MTFDRLPALLCVCSLFACAADEDAPASDSGAATSADDDGDGGSVSTSVGSSADSAADSAADTTDGGASTGDPDLMMAAHEFLARWPGLWSGPVDSMTSAGDFPVMFMDARPADGHTLFSRVDLDGGNSLRFAFVIEEQDGPELVFRNGGEFLGILRDSRTRLVEADLAAETWRFCSIPMGCDYIDAVFDFDGADSMLLHVDVKNMVHFDWPADRVEMRELDGPFPVDDTAQPGDEPFPPMPTLTLHLSWNEPLAEATSVWIVLSKTACLTGSCHPSRFMAAQVEAGATSVDLVLEQIHADTYKGTAVLDRNGDFESSLFPNTGDTVSVPDSNVVVDAMNSEASLFLGIDV